MVYFPNLEISFTMLLPLVQASSDNAHLIWTLAAEEKDRETRGTMAKVAYLGYTTLNVSAWNKRVVLKFRRHNRG